jgi:geranylgeranyl diphosphate synthase type II
MDKYQNLYHTYKGLINNKLEEASDPGQPGPQELYLPVRYILSGGGKRIRPVLLIFCCEALGGNIERSLDAAAAIEILHNFTLVHDDIMDNADTRRGRETIHKKWNVNTAILAGDHMIGIAYDFLLNTNSERLKEIVKTFTNGIMEVCEGQSYDKEFESRKDISIGEYLVMIRKKTAVMLEAAAEIGGLIGNGDNASIDNLKNYAMNLGLAFQIQDDILDITGDEPDFGKKIGGDLLEGKKTYLLLKAFELVNDKTDRERIERIIQNNGVHEDEIGGIKNIYDKYGVIGAAQERVKYYTREAERNLDFLKDRCDEYEKLLWFSQMLLSRNF